MSKYGLTSPVGLEQGRFRVVRDAQGTATAVNGRGNAGLFASTEQRARTKGIKLSARSLAAVRRSEAGPLDLQALEDTIRTFAGTN